MDGLKHREPALLLQALPPGVLESVSSPTLLKT